MWKIVLFFSALCILSSTSDAQDDKLETSSGDILVGEIKRMVRSVITFKTDYSNSDFKIDWDEIVSVESDRTFILHLTDGRHLNGQIKPDSLEKSAILLAPESPLEYKLDDIIYIEPLEKTFWSRLKASIDFGYTYTRNENMQQYSLRSELHYLTETWDLELHSDLLRSTQDNADRIRRINGIFNARRFLVHDWFFIGSYDLLQNDEQLLELRSTSQAGIGKFIFDTGSAYLAFATGLAWNNERFTSEVESENNSLESFISTNLSLFDVEDLYLNFSGNFYPSLTEKSRIRANAKLDIKYDLIHDFYIRLGYTHNFDSQVAEGGQETDFVIQTSIGWSLN